MTNKLVKKSADPSFGEDVHALLKREKSDGLEVADLEKRVFANYLNNIRHEFETNNELRGILVKADPATSAEAEVITLLSWMEHPDTPELFRKAVNMLLCELENMRKEEPAAYLIDRSTGLAVKPLEEGDIFQPPDYIDEDGNKKQSIKKVHPKIAATLTMGAAEIKRKEELQVRLDDPKYKHALAHIRDPEGIIKRARSLLESRGIVFMPMEEGVPTVVEFGKEHVHGDEQSINPAFHRISNHASVLASKVLKLAKTGDCCWMDNFCEKKSAKSRWYVVHVWIKPVSQLN